jgi:hypothetical protein
MSVWLKTVLAATVVAVMACATGGAALAQQPAVQLFKVITAKDEVEIGLPADEVSALGGLDGLAKKIAADGQITVWQYAVHKNASGDLEHAPLKKVAIFKTDTLRIEPFNPAPLKVAAPEK